MLASLRITLVIVEFASLTDMVTLYGKILASKFPDSPYSFLRFKFSNRSVRLVREISKDFIHYECRSKIPEAAKQ